MKTLTLLALVALGTGLPARAATPLTESTFTEIIHEANVVAAADRSVLPARTNQMFRAPDLVRTGPASRVELTAPDQTITRVGANTVFTFEPGGRNILLEKGSVLFHAPAGAGGGTVRYRGTAAAVLGTTMICAVLPDGSFKILDLEGHVQVTLKNNTTIVLDAGQMVIVRPDGDEFGAVLVFNLAQVTSRLLLVTGFANPLSSLPLIADAIRLQQEQANAGTLPAFVPFTWVVFALDLSSPPPLPTWMRHAHDRTDYYISPVTTFPNPPWSFGGQN
jgi:hypothetical protein